MNVLPDTSVIVDGRVSEKIDDGTFADVRVLVPEAVVAELEAQANEGLPSGWEGLKELQRLADLADDGRIELEYIGERPDAVARDTAAEGTVDAMIRSLAADRDALFFTSDVVQSEVARAKGIDVEYISPRPRDVDHLSVEEYFDQETMSVHLKVGLQPMAKRGTLGDMHYEAIGDAALRESTLKELAQEIEDGAKESSDGFIELDEPGMTIVQFRDLRIAIARPPFSEALEITAVRPIAETSLEDYHHAQELKERLLERQRGVLIAGAPGAGKSTFAQAVAEFLSQHDYAVKTMEKPRDLQVGPEVTQYTALGGDMAKTADSLLMVRPDYTIYDEVRKTEDFEVFADMRLAGVGMIGVVHATRAIDALQRLVGRVELGMIPQIVDTVVYIEAGQIHTVYDVVTEVKVPAGLIEEDLARPVIVIRDFETNTPEYEIYTFNRQVVTVPVGEATEAASGVDRLAAGEVERAVRRIATGPVEVELTGANKATVYLTEADIPAVIGSGGEVVQELEANLG
ncbi:MAG: PINc/VapC family ATPase, partial [Halobacteriota archaeon]